MADRLDILLGILLDKTAQAGTERGIEALEEKLRSLDEAQLDNVLKEFDLLLDRLDETQKRYQQLENRIKQFDKAATVASQAASISGRVLGIGLATTGGIFAAANKYVQDAERATAVTRQWQAEMDLIRRNGERIGATLAKEALPMLTQAARVTGRIASFIEQNPGLIKAAIGFGTAATVIGAIGTTTFKAIETFSRVGSIITTAQLAAAKLMNTAADKQLVAAGLSKGGAGLGGVLSTGARVATIATLAVGEIILAVSATNAVLDAIGAPQLQEMAEAQLHLWRNIGRVLSGDVKLNDLAAEAVRLAEASRDARKEVGGLSGAIKGVSSVTSFGGGLSPDVVNAYIAFRENALAIEKKFQQDRLRIIENFNKSISEAQTTGARAISRITDNYQRTIEQITKDARREDIEAERDYQEQRSQIIRDAGQDIQRIEEDLRERLRELAIGHEQRMEDLALNRDALGIIQEQRRYDQERSEAERQTNIEIARRRQDLAVRLQDMQREHELERAQRAEQLAQQLQDAQEQYEREIQEQRAANAERLRELRQARAEQMRELELARREEQIRNRQAFIAQIRDLDAALLGETNLRRGYYARMLEDAKAFFEQYRSAMPGGSGISGSTGTIPSRQFGGYAPAGLVNTHAGEYVMTRNTTRAMESLVGGRLSERALQGIASGGGRVTWNDERRFYGGISPAERRMITEDTLELIDGLGGA